MVLEVVAFSEPSTAATRRQDQAFEAVRPALRAWRTVRLGGREFIDGLVRDGAAAPDGPLAAALTGWPGAWYWRDRTRHRLVLVRPLAPDPAPRWWLHVGLLLTTILCSLGAGAALAGAWYPSNGRGLLGALEGAWLYLAGLPQGDWRYVLTGWQFAVPLLTIMLVHELGHFLAARRYALHVSPPYFLPIPPNLSPIGSLGAYIALRTPVLDRRQLLDVGAAGPLAGFMVVAGVLVWGYLTSFRVDLPALGASSFVEFAGRPIALGESLLTRWLGGWLVPGSGAIHLSLPAFAGWVGAFITALNLLPLSQLDGGHVLYGLLGRRQVIAGVLAIAGLLILAQQSWSWYLWVALALLVGRGRLSHPSVIAPSHPVPASRQWIGWLCVLILIGTFVPVPFVH